MSRNHDRDILAVISPNGVRKDPRQSPRLLLSVPAWIWRQHASEPIPVRLFDESTGGTGFMSPVPLDLDETIELALGHTGVRRATLRVMFCEGNKANQYRIGAQA
jgi:hypothetical protein